LCRSVVGRGGGRRWPQVRVMSCRCCMSQPAPNRPAPTCQDEVGAAACVGQCHRSANALRRAGDHGHRARQVKELVGAEAPRRPRRRRRAPVFSQPSAVGLRGGRRPHRASLPASRHGRSGAQASVGEGFSIAGGAARALRSHRSQHDWRCRAGDEGSSASEHGEREAPLRQRTALAAGASGRGLAQARRVPDSISPPALPRCCIIESG
jgi:hypothetical protein